MTYRIYLEGRLEPRWESWFEDMHIECKQGTTVLYGEVADQPALHGLLKRVRDLGLIIVRVERLEPLS